MREEFKNVRQVLAYLQDEGFKIKKSKIYADVEKGYLKIQEDKSVLGIDVELYSHTLDKEKEDPEARKDKAEERKLKNENFQLKNQKLKFEYDKARGKYIANDEANLNQVNLLVVLDLNFRQMIEEIMPDICNTLTGNMTKVNEAKNLAEEKWTDLLHDLTRVDSYTVNCSAEDNRDDN